MLKTSLRKKKKRGGRRKGGRRRGGGGEREEEEEEEGEEEEEAAAAITNTGQRNHQPNCTVCVLLTAKDRAHSVPDVTWACAW